MIFAYRDNSKSCNLLYTNFNDMENLRKNVILAEEVVKFLPYNNNNCYMILWNNHFAYKTVLQYFTIIEIVSIIELSIIEVWVLFTIITQP